MLQGYCPPQPTLENLLRREKGSQFVPAHLGQWVSFCGAGGKGILQIRANDARMSMKTKDRFGMLRGKAGML